MRNMSSGVWKPILHNKGIDMTHAAGVDYDQLDAHKRDASRGAAETLAGAYNFQELGWEVIEWSRGESVFLVRHTATGLILGFLVEGLGTKNLIAEIEALRSVHGRTFYDVIGWDTVAMVFNDAISLGAMPLVFAQHPALGDGGHLVGQNGIDLTRGTVEACKYSGAVYGPGETPGLGGIILPETMCLSGAGLAHVPREEDLMNPDAVEPGLQILMLGSSGVHANGISAIRKMIHKWPEGYQTLLGNGRTFGSELLVKTQIYVPFIRECQKRGVRLRYSAHISGHGWAKIQRSKNEVTYCVDSVPESQPVFHHIQSLLGYSVREMYGAYNMGAGFCLFAELQQVLRIMDIGRDLGIPVYLVGKVQEGPRRVVIEPLGIEFTPEDVDIR